MTAGRHTAVPLLPQSTNAEYRGSLAAAHLLAVLGILTLVPGLIHTLLPDGGAGTIAGIDLTRSGPVVVALFAWAGATQIVFGLVMLAAALRYRPFVPAVLALLLLERGLHALNAWVLKPGSGHHPPEHWAVLVGVPVIVVGLVLALRPRHAAGAA